MGLIKKTMSDYGIEGEYWKISRFTIDTIHKEVFFTLNLYRTKMEDAKELGEYIFSSPSLVEFDIDFTDDYYNYFIGDKGKKYKDFLTACYCYAKDKIEYFKDAIDDEEEVTHE